MRLANIVSLIVICFCLPGAVAAKKSIRALPHVLVYKTKKDYRKYVAVELSADKKTVVSYPDPADVKTGGGYPLPVLLHKGYLLDKRGISRNTAFIKMTYEQYAALKAPPTAEELYSMIIDKDPIKELYDCGPRNAQKKSENQLNQLIDRKQLKKKCIAIK